MQRIQHFLFVLILGLTLALAGCMSSSPTDQSTDSFTPAPKASSTPELLPTATATPTFNRTAYFLTNPPPTPTRTPVVDVDGNVTWHPQKVLISWDESPNDGNSAYVYPNFVLYWDGSFYGSLVQPPNDGDGLSIMKLNQDEVCKILNTVEATGFFDEPNYYNFPFDGAWGSYIDIHGWKSNWSGAQQLFSAVAGAAYYDTLFCRDCPIPSAETVIKPGLANTYYFLRNYQPVNPQTVLIKNILVDIGPADEESSTAWPLTSMSLEQFIASMKCSKDCNYTYQAKVFSGDLAQEIMDKIGNGSIFKSQLFGTPSIRITYKPQPADVPADATLTCNVKAGQYPILHLNKNNKFWYYAPGGKWGAEVVAGENKLRIVNTSGYEKFYQYDATFFGQQSIQFYPRFWSEDNQFFYVNILPGDYKPDTSLGNSIGLEQIDVKNEKIKYLFLGTKGETFVYEFSTEREAVAYIRQGDNPLKLVFVNPVSGEEHAVRLTRAEGTPYSFANTLIWYENNDTLYLAAGYTENGIEKTDILATHPDNLANMRIIYPADKPMNLIKDIGSDSSALICPIQNDTDNSCLRLNTETGEIQD